MITSKSYQVSFKEMLRERFAEYAQLVKMRLTLLVVFSSAMGYVYASGATIEPLGLFGLILGGFMITGAANTFNQVYEREIDQLMVRTANRPIASGRVSLVEGILFGVLMTVVGTWALHEFTNILCTAFGLASLVIYAFIYTPLKRVGNISVYIGAIPGAMPFILGYVAFMGDFTFEAGLLFFIQFIWQLPHTWSIAWLLNKDYSKAGIKMLPLGQKVNKANSVFNLFFVLLLVPVALLPVFYGFTSWITIGSVAIGSILFVLASFGLVRENSIPKAKKVLFASILFLPLVQIGMVLDKLIF